MAKKKFDTVEDCECVLISPKDDSVDYLGKEEEDVEYWRACQTCDSEGWTGSGWRWEYGLTNRTALALARFIARFNGYRLVKEPKEEK